MSNVLRFQSWVSGTQLAFIRTLLLAVVGTTCLLCHPAQAQTYTILHSFTDQGDGGNPYAGVTIDAKGNLYGTTTEGYTGQGSVFKMSRESSYWLLSTLYEFSGNDGAFPYGGLVRDAGGVLYGTTCCGGNSQDGTVFKVQPSPTPPRSILAQWKETILHSFIHNGTDGVGPVSTLVFDRAGNLYGTTVAGGTFYDGAVFQLARANGGWTESVLYSFTGLDGADPRAGVVLDKKGNLYGTTAFGGPQNCGMVFRLTPGSSGWMESVLYSFAGNGDGCRPWAGVTLDAVGNLYGATAMTNSGELSGGTVFELSPSQDGWNYSLLYTFNGGNHSQCSEGWGSGPASSLTLDDAGNLYGTTQANGAFGYGNVFELAPVGNGWTYTSLHDFNPSNYDGAYPCGGVTFDASGNLYGTTLEGGSFPNIFGIVWEISP